MALGTGDRRQETDRPEAEEDDWELDDLGRGPVLPSQQVDSKSRTSRCESLCMLALAAWPPCRLLVRIASSFVLPAFPVTSFVLPTLPAASFVPSTFPANSFVVIVIRNRSPKIQRFRFQLVTVVF